MARKSKTNDAEAELALTSTDNNLHDGATGAEESINHQGNDRSDTTTSSLCAETVATSQYAQAALEAYLAAGSPPPKSWQRVVCCESSRSLYCPVCCRLLVPNEDWPDAIRDNKFLHPLPFDLHILVDDRRASSTGVQVQAIFNPRKDSTTGHATTAHGVGSQEQALPLTTEPQSAPAPVTTVELFDLGKGEIPVYKTSIADNQLEGTYLLFPGKDSVPLSSVLNTSNNGANHGNNAIKRLVVLDCKWSRPSMNPFIASLPKVSLDNPPEKSYYWRWHNTGPGMLSTVEAIYFAAWQITTSLGWKNEQQKETLLSMFWLFRLQRAIIQDKHVNNERRGVNPHVPFTEEAKDFARKLRAKERQIENNKRKHS